MITYSLCIPSYLRRNPRAGYNLDEVTRFKVNLFDFDIILVPIFVPHD